MAVIDETITNGIKQSHKAGHSLACIVIDVHSKTSAFGGQLSVLKLCGKLGIHVWFFGIASERRVGEQPDKKTKPQEYEKWLNQEKVLGDPAPPYDELFNVVPEGKRHSMGKLGNNPFKGTSLHASLKITCSGAKGAFPGISMHASESPFTLIIMGEELCSCVRCAIVESGDQGFGAVNLGYRVITGRKVVRGDHRSGSAMIETLGNVSWYLR